MVDQYLLAGKIGAVHGLKGWMKIHSFTTPLENIIKYQPWFIDGLDGYQPIIRTEHRWQANGLVVHFKGLDSRETTTHLTNKPLYIQRAQLPALKKGDYYWQELVGLQVSNLEGIDFGIVTSMLATGANDVLYIEGEKIHCVPYLPKQVIKQVDLLNKTMLVDWPAEL